MAKTQKKRPKAVSISRDPDSVYILKIVLFFLIGTFWVHVATDSMTIPLPLGLAIGLWFASHDHFKIDRKIEYAVLLVAMFISYFLSPRFLIVL